MSGEHSTAIGARVTLLRCADILAEITRQLSLAAFSKSLRRLIVRVGSNPDIDAGTLASQVLAHGPRILAMLDEAVDKEVRAADAYRAARDYLRSPHQMADPAQTFAYCAQFESDAHVGPHESQPPDSTADANSDESICERQLHEAVVRLAAFRDLKQEIHWCLRGIELAARALGDGTKITLAPYPVREFVRQREFQAWVADLAEMTRQSAAVLPEVAGRLNPVIARLVSPTATLTFGGRFNAGKSSLLNAALGRPLLPTKDLTETGVSCHLSIAAADEAILVTRDARRTIACDTAAIRSAISLSGGQAGTERTADARRLELRLHDFPGGTAVEWIDPPGMFDRDEMTERAWESANSADVVIFVLRSQQFLGEAEAEAVAELVMQRGPASVCFVENAFLPNDVADPWEHHRKEIAPVNRSKLRHFAAELGLEKQQTPPLIVVSAREVLARGHSYGGGLLRRLLGRLGAPEAPLIRRARLQWLARALDGCREIVRAEWTGVKVANIARQAAYDEHVQQRSKRDAAFEARVDEELERFLTEFSTAAVKAGAATAALIESSVQRDQTYQDHLNQQLKSEAHTLGKAMVARIDRHAAALEHATMTDGAKVQLKNMLTPTTCQVVVANNDISYGKVLAVGAGGAAAGSVIPFLGTVLGGIAGTIGGIANAASDAMAKDCSDTKDNIHAAAQNAPATVRLSISTARTRILDLCGPTSSKESPTPPDLQTEKLLQDLLEELDAQRSAADDWLRYEIDL